MARDLGSVEKLPSGNFRATYMHKGARYRAPMTFPTKNMARAWLGEQQLLIFSRTWVPPEVQTARKKKQAEQEALTVGVWVERWLESQRSDLRVSSFQSKERVIHNRITEVDGAAGKLKDIALIHLDRAAVLEWWEAIKAQFPKTKPTNNKAYGFLKSAMEEAVESEHIDANPVHIKSAAKKPKPKKEPLPTQQELQSIVDNTPKHYQLAAVLCFFHGMRVGEVLGLKREDLTQDPETGQWQVTISRNMQRVQDDDGHCYMLAQEPKTDAGYRTVPIFAGFTKYVTIHLKEVYKGGEYLTMTKRGKTLMDTNLRNELGKAKKAAGITKKIKPHKGRNFLITLLAEQGATPQEIGSVLGQSDLKTITETYMQVRQENRAMVLQRAGNVLQGKTAEVVDINARKGDKKQA